MDRRASIEQIQSLLGPEVELTMVWISALIQTTRESHPALHGIAADGAGQWELGGEGALACSSRFASRRQGELPMLDFG